MPVIVVCIVVMECYSFVHDEKRIVYAYNTYNFVTQMIRRQKNIKIF